MPTMQQLIKDKTMIWSFLLVVFGALYTNFSYLQTFIEQFLSSEEEWSSESIRLNAEKMADYAYRSVWKFEPPL